MRPRSTGARGRFGWLASYLASAVVVASSLVALSAAPAVAVGQQVFDSFDGSVNAMAEGADGTTYVGGDFTGWGPQTGGGAVVNATSAQVVRNFPAVGGSVYAATSDGVGGWYIGGFFSSVGGVPRRNAAHILPTGAVNPNWNPNPDGTVFRILVLRGVVYLGGEFTTLCGTGSSCGGTTPRYGAAAFNPDGTLTTWNLNLSGAVLAMAASDDASTIYLGGRFTSACGAGSSCGETQVSRPNLAAVRTDGTLVAEWNPSVSVGAGALPSSIHAIAVFGTTVYVGGDFTKICGVGSSCGDTVRDRSRAAAINTDGTLSDIWKPVVSGGYPRVSDLVVSPDGSTVYLGGDFTSIDSVARGYAGAVTAGGTLTDWNPNLGAKVWGLELAGTTMYVAGEFSTACGVGTSSCGDVVTRSRLAAFGTDGGVLPWNPNVNSLAREVTQVGSVVYIGGAFTSMVTEVRNRLAAVDANGALTSWNPNASGTVSALAVSGSTVYAGGSFTAVGGQTRTRLAAIGTDGIPADWNPVANGTVSALAVDGSTIYAGGAFSLVCGTGSTCGGTPETRNRAAAFNSDGTLVGPWNPNFNLSVNALAVADGIVYAGGAFTTSGATTRKRLAALDAAGALTAWNPTVNDSSPASATVAVNSLRISGSTVYLGGYFQNLGVGVDLKNRSRLASVRADTGAVTNWNPNANLNVNALAISGSTLYAGGQFTTIAGTSRTRLAAFNIADATPSLVTTWTPVAGGNVSALVANSTSVLAGGSFTTATGTINGSAQAARFALFPASGLAESPTGVAAARGNASAAVTWTAPTNVGSGITGYRLESAPGPNYDTWTVRVADTGSAATSATVTGLVNGTNYRIRVTSLTSAGAGGRSIPSQWFSPVAPSATPAVPTGLTGIPGNGKITASWNPVIDVGVGATFINRYRTFALAGATAVSVCNTTGTLAVPPATTCELTGLTNGQSFTLTTRSFNNRNKFSDLSPTEGPYTPSH